MLIPLAPTAMRMNKKEIGLRLKELREERGLHQKEVAAVLGVSQPAYCDMENGHTAFKAVDLDKLAEYYGKSLDELLRGDKYVLHMHDQSSNGTSVHNEYKHGVSEELLARVCDLLETNAAVSKELAVLLARMNAKRDSDT